MIDALSGLGGVLLGSAGTVLTTRFLQGEQRRQQAWDVWVELNAAVRTGQADTVASAIGRVEMAWKIAGLPDLAFESARASCWWYQRYFRLIPHGGQASPVLMHEMHQMTVNLLRYYLKRPWWRPRSRPRKYLQALSNSMAIVEPAVEEFLDQLEAFRGGVDGAPDPGVDGTWWLDSLDEDDGGESLA